MDKHIRGIKVQILDYLEDQLDSLEKSIKERFVDCDIEIPEDFLDQKFNPFAEAGMLEDSDNHAEDLATYHYIKLIIYDIRKIKEISHTIVVTVSGGIAYIKEDTIPDNILVEVTDYDEIPAQKYTLSNKGKV